MLSTVLHRALNRPGSRDSIFVQRMRSATVGLLLLALAVPAHAQTEYLALITDLNGTALVAEGDRSEFEPAVWGMQLFAGDRVKTEDGSDVSILFANNNLIVLGPNSAMTISAGPGADGTTAVKSIEQDLYGTLASLKGESSSKSRGRALAGLRSGGAGAELRLVSPRNTKLKDPRPTFVWHSEKEYETYVLRLYDASGLVWSREVETNRLNYPEDEAPLVSGHAYFWDVEGQALLDTEESEKVGFTLLSDDEIARIAAQESAFESILEDEKGTNYHFAVGAFYAREGLVESAIASFEEIAERHPTSALPHEILGRLYEEVGLQDHALAAHDRAVALRQEN